MVLNKNHQERIEKVDLDSAIDIAIIGGGPAGLSLAYCLQKINPKIDYLIFEKGHVGESFQQMPDHLTLITPPKANLLPGDFNFFSYVKYFFNTERWTAHRFANYLKDYQKRFHLKIQENTKIEKVELSEDKKYFILHTQDKKIPCRRVVSATGYFSFPISVASNAINGFTGPIIHFQQFKNSDQLKRFGNRVLIIGKRLSAGQVIRECVAAGMEVSLLVRSPIQFTSGPWKLRQFLRFVWEIESLFLLLQKPLSNIFPNLKKFSKIVVPMEAGDGKEAIEKGLVAVYNKVLNLQHQTILLEDQNNNKQQKIFDVVVETTGFCAGLPHLNKIIDQNTLLKLEQGLFIFKSQESEIKAFSIGNIAGLYQLGREGIVDRRSRFLRGIRSDSKILAKILCTK